MKFVQRLGLAIGALMWVVSCGGSKTTSGGAGNGEQTGSDAGTVTPAGPTAASTGIGPIPVAASEEKTVCIIKNLGNAEDLVATSFVTDLAPGSHHLIVYRSTATAEQLTPTACSPFQGILQGDVPLVIVTREHLEYDLPKGVGVPLAPNQMLKIEAHYINATATAIQGQGTVAIHGQTAAATGPYQAADVGLWGTTQISVPARGTFTTPTNFQAGAAGMNIFALTTHEHHLGTEVKVWSSAAKGDTADQVADDKDWGSPLLEQFNPPLAQDGTKGLSYQCSWSNTTDQAVSFGESALNEMCFVIFYYYPSHGTDLCLDGSCMGRTQ
ncbi:MAG TPA: hypothetical protein VGI39_17310 [Polyangiaceae bacterium]